MSRPSEPLLKWLRQQLDRRSENTASLAAKLGRSRAELRKVLTGVEPLTVDDLVRITEALGLSLQDMGVQDPSRVEEVAEDIDAGEESSHWDNQPRALFQLGFDQGIDFLFLVAADQLGDWGGPDAVREAHKGRDLPIQLDSQFHRYMNPRFEDDAIELRLSFDTLYECRFPWSAIRRVVFTPLAPAPPSQGAAEPTKGKPVLRLVR